MVTALSRLGLTGVAFVAFRYAPAGVYEKPEWSSYWPHLA